MTYFVWTKMQAAGGEPLEAIVSRKEAERHAGKGEFWWGIGNSLGSAIDEAADTARGNLPILFSRMLSPPKSADSNPAAVCVWNGWVSKTGKSGDLPAQVLVTGGSDPGKAYYALACFSENPLVIADHGNFDPSQCRTSLGKVPGSSQVTALLRDISPGTHKASAYNRGFRGKLRVPWSVKLTGGRLLSNDERKKIDGFKPGDDWASLVRMLRQ